MMQEANPDTAAGMDTLVSVIIPCYNAAATIDRCLHSLYAQTFPRESMEILVVDGMSTDDTRARVGKFASTHPSLCIRILSNQKRRIPHAVNIGLRAARGDIFVRMDAHSVPSAEYVAQCVKSLQEKKGDNVGGLLDIRPQESTYAACAIAIAAAHPLGSGGAQYRSGGEAGEVDTVAFGAYTRDTLEKNGYFNEDLLANEDYEWNARLRARGGKVWFDPAIRCQYFARKRFTELSRQYFNYGYWKVAMLRSYPGTIRLRQLLPPLVVIVLLASLAMSVGSLLMLQSQYPYILVGIIPLLYLLTLGLGTLFLRKATPFHLVPGIVLAVATMHISWGSGFLVSLLSRSKKLNSDDR